MLAAEQVASHENSYYYDDPTAYILHYGFPVSMAGNTKSAGAGRSKEDQRRSFQAQDEAYLRVQSKIGRREDKARALLISSNVLSMSIMASQLRMHRWRVSEAQTVTQATSILQDEIFQAVQRGYCVSRRRVPPHDPFSDEAAKVRTSAKCGFSKYANKTRSEIDNLFNPDAINAPDNTEEDAAALGPEGKSSCASELFCPGALQRNSSSGSLCSAELPSRGYPDRKGRGQRSAAQLLPGDAITQLVIVDSFTHEPFPAIMDHLRYFNSECGLELVVLLLLHGLDRQGLACAGQAQGAGLVLAPQHGISPEAAYACGYDLVLAHHFDHVVVDLLTQTFITSAGRWRNDVRSRAAVGNYMSMQNILMGKLSTDELRQFVWNESADENEILDMLNAVRYPPLPIAKDISPLKGPCEDALQKSVGANGDNGELGLIKFSNDVIPSMLSRLRVREVGSSGVKSVTLDRETQSLPLTSLDLKNDVLQNVMHPSKAPQRLQHAKARSILGENDDIGNDLFIDETEEVKGRIIENFEKEISRLLAEKGALHRECDALRTDLDNAHQLISTLEQRRDSKRGSIVSPLCMEYMESSANGSFAHLSKEQQVYMLKERLDEANETIRWLMSDSPRRASTLDQMQRRVRSSGPDSARGAVDRKRIAICMDIRRNEMLAHRKRLAHQVYREHREAELLALLDFDAAAGSEEPHDFKGSLASGDGSVAPQQFVFLRLNRTPAELEADSRTRVTMNNTIDRLEKEIHRIRHVEGGNDSAAHNTLLLLESALELLYTLQQHIQHLEEVQVLNETWYKRYGEKPNHLQKERGAGTDKDTEKLGEGTARRFSRSNKNRTLKAKSVTDKKQQLHRAALSQDRRSDNERSPGGKKTTGNAAFLKAPSAAKPPSPFGVDEAEKRPQFSQVLCDRGDLPRQRERLIHVLARLHTKARHPYTTSYRRLLEAEHTEARQQAQGMWNRLRHLLDNFLGKDQAGTPDQCAVPRTLELRLVSPAMRAQLDEIAREWACYVSFVKYMELAIGEVNRKIQEGAPQQLVERRRNLLKAAQDTEVNLEEHLNAMKDLAAVELELSMWSDVDVSQYLSRGETSQPMRVIVQSPQRSLLSEGAEPGDTMVILDVNHFIHDMRTILDLTSGMMGNDILTSPTYTSGGTIEGKATTMAQTGEELSALPVLVDPPREHGLPSSDRVLALLRSAQVSPGQRDLYKALLKSHSCGLIHSDYMIDVNALVCRGLAHRDKWNARTCDGDTDEACDVNAMRWRSLYWVHHQELMRLLRLLLLQVPMLRPLLEPYIGKLEIMLSEEFRHAVKSTTTTDGMEGNRVALEPDAAIMTATLPFLIAADSALTSASTDILWTLWERGGGQSKAFDAATSAEHSDGGVGTLRDLEHPGTLEHSSHATGRSVKTHEQPRSIAVEALNLLQKRRSLKQSRDAARDGMDSKNCFGHSNINIDMERGDLFLTEIPSPPPVSGQLANDEVGYTAEQVAALFTRRPCTTPWAGATAGLSVEDIYLGPDMEIDHKSNFEGDTENASAIQRIRSELEYLNAVSRQRMEELALRRRLQDRKHATDFNGLDVPPTVVPDRQHPDHQAAREVPDFEVKGGCPAWYGVEAAKRVRNILRRRAKPDQIILNAGSNGIGVGIELSRRTALPNSWVNSTEQETSLGEDNTSPDAFSTHPRAVEGRHRVQLLPPLHQRGLSRWQKLRQRAGWVGGLDGPGEAEAALQGHKIKGDYVCPRDDASLRAFRNIASLYEFEAVDKYLYTPTAFLERLAEYRDVVRRAAARLGISSPFHEENFGEPPRYVPMPAGSLSASSSRANLCNGHSPPHEQLRNFTSWTYGVEDADLKLMLETPVERCDSVALVPYRGCSTFLERYAQRQRCGEKDASGSALPFISGAPRLGLSVSPAAAAAQRLTYLLRSSFGNTTPERGNVHAGSFTPGDVRGRQFFSKPSEEKNGEK